MNAFVYCDNFAINAAEKWKNGFMDEYMEKYVLRFVLGCELGVFPHSLISGVSNFKDKSA